MDLNPLGCSRVRDRVSWYLSGTNVIVRYEMFHKMSNVRCLDDASVDPMKNFYVRGPKMESGLLV